MKGQNYIAGEWLNSTETIENRNPSDTSDIIGHYAQANTEQLCQAVAAARKAQPQWAETGLEKRQAVLNAIGVELMSRAAELGELLSREEGKPRNEGVGEVFRAGQFFSYYAAEVLRQLGENANSVRPNIEIDVRREPVGIVAVISPWNFPLATACWKIAPALAFGNAVVWKPANLTPAVAVEFAAIIAKQDIPLGVFNLTMGGGTVIGRALAQHPDIDAISFTGSLETGKIIAQDAARNLTKLQMEMGSKNPLVVMDDADMNIAVSCATAGAYGGTGQKCTASSRLIVHSKVHDEFVEKMAIAATNLKVGHALEKDTQIGPAVSETQLLANLDYLQLAQKEGAQHIFGGEQLTLETDGYYLSPALFTGSNNLMRINREEMFAPIACVIAVDSYEEALAAANDTEYGLIAGIITRSLSRATHFRQHSKTGCVTVNLPTAGTDYHVPFGGRKKSSYGAREQGRIAAEFYTAVKTAYTYAGLPD
ncbi:aldehyde dehydrogenase family protein [Candidatus Persebacteraceae bacterium Df01]|uniref:Aldehyde dehydrogenase family protein n=1 Tax=Candidatus Doriopsillibacter californiensis TaxID=2970740 RepID=A0ABT7QN06_9GAMM|nr:aldehyde dehydrogenase family protein [Candidatus Persebacteraceae bacterium Df01]